MRGQREGVSHLPLSQPTDCAISALTVRCRLPETHQTQTHTVRVIRKPTNCSVIHHLRLRCECTFGAVCMFCAMSVQMHSQWPCMGIGYTVRPVSCMTGLIMMTTMTMLMCRHTHAYMFYITNMLVGLTTSASAYSVRSEINGTHCCTALICCIVVS